MSARFSRVKPAELSVAQVGQIRAGNQDAKTLGPLTYVRRILRLAYLAPDVVLAIAEGRHPPTLVLQRLLRPIPLAWAEQRQTLGFST